MQTRKIFRQGLLDAFQGAADLQVNWIITEMCNYACSYCYGQEKIDRQKFTSWEQLKIAADKLVALNRPKCTFTFSGGEPTIHPELSRLISYLHSKLVHNNPSFLIISNGSRGTAFYQSVLTKLTGIRLKFIISIHTEYVKIAELTRLIKELSPHAGLAFSLMFNPERREYVKEIYDVLTLLQKKYDFSLSPRLLRSPPNFSDVDPRYNVQDMVWFQSTIPKQVTQSDEHDTPASGVMWDFMTDGRRELAFNLNHGEALSSGMLNFRGMYCAMGTRVIGIDPDGSCMGARCDAAKSASVNIFYDNPFATSLPGLIQCPMANCGCVTNTTIPKFDHKSEAVAFIKNWRQRSAIPT